MAEYLCADNRLPNPHDKDQVNDSTTSGCVEHELDNVDIPGRWPSRHWSRGVATVPMPWPLPNVWLGTSCEDQATADERMPLLLDCPAAVRFVSLEPLLGPINLIGHRDPVTRTTSGGCLSPRLCATQIGGLYERPSIDWVIVGGESGPHARPCSIDWIRAIVQQCQAAEVPVFVKQLSQCSNPQHYKAFDDWPDEIRVRQYPRGGEA